MNAYLRQLRRKSSHDQVGNVLASGFQCGERHTALSFHVFDLETEGTEIRAYCGHSWSQQGDRIGVAFLYERDFIDLNQTLPELDDEYVEDDPFFARHHKWPCPDANQALVDSLIFRATRNRLIQGFCQHGKSERLNTSVEVFRLQEG